MTHIADVITLMHEARRRVRSVRATLVQRRRPELLERAFCRFAERVELSRGGGYFHVPVGGVAPDDDSDVHTWQIELAADRTRLRQQRKGPNVESLLVVDGERWWEWSAAFGLRTHEQTPGVRHVAGLDLLDPSKFLSGFALDAAGEGVMAGRQAWRVLVSRDSAAPWPTTLEPGVDDGELMLDAERGLILRRAALVEGQEAAVLEVEKIAYDVELPVETFSFELPPGASAQGSAEARATTLDAAGALASFRVYKLRHVPPDWRVQVLYSPAIEGPTLPEAVTLIYTRRDGSDVLEIRETLSEHHFPATGVRHFEHSGRHYVALGPERPAGREPAELIFALETTRMRMSSHTLPLTRLLEFSQLLVEVEPTRAT